MRIWQQFEWNGALDKDLKPLRVPENAPAPFKQGCWEIGWTNIGEATDRLALCWAGVDERTTIKSLRLAFVGVDRRNEIWSMTSAAGTFPSSRMGRLQSPQVRTPGKMLVRLDIEVDDSEPTTPLHATPSIAAMGQRFAAFTAGPSVFDVRLSFPRTGQEIWTNETTLRRSPYFDNLLSSGFSEAAGESSEAASQPDVDLDAAFDDSDVETDKKQSKCTTSARQSLPPHKTVRVTEAGYSTYLAIVCWLQCGHVEFATLSSSLTNSVLAEGQELLRLATNSPSPPAVSPIPATSPGTPRLLPVSPKSVYRLAHLLELPRLVSLALDNYRSQLSIANAINEVFTETAACYEEVGTAALDFAMAHLKDVQSTPAMKEVRARADAGGLEDWESRVWALFAMRGGGGGDKREVRTSGAERREPEEGKVQKPSPFLLLALPES